jgi:hypothetical protein
VILILSLSSTRLRVFCTPSTLPPGAMRQLTIARASWGSAFSA